MDEDEEDLSGLHPGALLYRSAALQNFPVMADALAHGADVNWVNVAEESSTPLIQAVSAVRTAVHHIHGRQRMNHDVLRWPRTAIFVLPLGPALWYQHQANNSRSTQAKLKIQQQINRKHASQLTFNIFSPGGPCSLQEPPAGHYIFSPVALNLSGQGDNKERFRGDDVGSVTVLRKKRKRQLTFSCFLTRTPWRPASSCCRTAPTSTRWTATGEGRFTTPPS